jgi:flagellar biosynthesis/type III secretory pathway protein FliH
VSPAKRVKIIASMAVLADKNLNWRPNQYHRKVWGSEITRTFEIVKLMDFKSKKEELLKNDNPFALIVLIQLAALETKADDENRLLTKLEFFRYLHQHGWSMEKAMNVYRFLDILLSLNPKFEIQYIEKAKRIDEDFNMNLTLTAERYGFQQGKQEGIQQGMQEGEGTMLMYLLELKFKAIPDLYRHKIKQADTQTLLKWAERVLEHQALEDVFK